MATYPTTNRDWLAKLVSFDTTCSNKSNIECIKYIEAYLATVGIKSEIVYSPDKWKAHLWATLPAHDGNTQGGIILSGHTDVVSVDGQTWKSDPWVLTEREGKLYGRGSADMKGFIAVVLAKTPELLKMKRLKPIHYAFSYDEELGCTGIPVLIDWLKKKGQKADWCLVGDGKMNVGIGNKGHSLWRVKVTGKAIHSSMALMNTSCNAIEYAAMIIAKVREIAIDVRENDTRDEHYTCPFSPMSTNLIKGGNAVNTVPAECIIEFSVRLTDTGVARSIDARIRDYVDKKILPAMRAECADAKVDIDAYNVCPAFNGKESAPLTKLVRKMLNDSKIRKAGGTTEAGFFQEEMGIPTVIVGPGGGRAHESDEWTTQKNLDDCTGFTMDLVSKCVAMNKPLESHL